MTLKGGVTPMMGAHQLALHSIMRSEVSRAVTNPAGTQRVESTKKDSAVGSAHDRNQHRIVTDRWSSKSRRRRTVGQHDTTVTRALQTRLFPQLQRAATHCNQSPTDTPATDTPVPSATAGGDTPCNQSPTDAPAHSATACAKTTVFS
jgi:hypothetical protein